jgi:hypothetical protein
MTNTKILARIRNSFKYRVLGIESAPSRDTRTRWEKKRDAHVEKIGEAKGEYRYFELLREHVTGGMPGNQGKIIPLCLIPIMVGARHIVELGSAFSSYPESYPDGSPWKASLNTSIEGAISTRTFLVACRFLKQMGIDATLTSVDKRDWRMFENTKKLFTDLDLLQYWRPTMGTDSIEWLKNHEQQIDVALVDSNHTYIQVAGELKGVLPLMAPNGVIIIDDCYNVDYQTGVVWNIDEVEDGISKGGEYGAILEFLERYPEWKPHWFPSSACSIMYLRRGNPCG